MCLYIEINWDASKKLPSLPHLQTFYLRGLGVALALDFLWSLHTILMYIQTWEPLP